MKPGKASQTAVMVASGRAIADGRTPVKAFSDPTAFALLPARAQERVATIRSGAPAASGRERIARAFAQRRSTMMIPRTVASTSCAASRLTARKARNRSEKSALWLSSRSGMA